MKITALAENTSSCSLPAEHGLSLFVETSACCFLFDMGQGSLFAHNAKQLGIDLAGADFAVVSHGHYDHGGGLETFLSVNSRAPVYMSQFAFEPHFNAENRDIGLDRSLEGSRRIRHVGDSLSPAEGITLCCPAGLKPSGFGSDGLGMLRDGQIVPEDFRHELYLLAEEEGRRILLSGCSHRGILNIMTWFRPDVFIGGFHLFHAPLDDTLRDIARKLDSFGAMYITGHCTGMEQFRFMQPALPGMRYLSTGESITV